jgi:hypothetical protein
MSLTRNHATNALMGTVAHFLFSCATGGLGASSLIGDALAWLAAVIGLCLLPNQKTRTTQDVRSFLTGFAAPLALQLLLHIISKQDEAAKDTSYFPELIGLITAISLVSLTFSIDSCRTRPTSEDTMHDTPALESAAQPMISPLAAVETASSTGVHPFMSPAAGHATHRTPAARAEQTAYSV